MRKLLAANWKENPKTKKKALKLFVAIAKAAVANAADIIVAPPFIYLEEIAKEHAKIRSAKKNLALGAQDVFWEDKGAYTSEIGPVMLKRLGVEYVIVGHSERRIWLHETDEMINKKIRRALNDGLRVIVCVGESAAVRRKGIKAAEQFIKNQLLRDFAGVARSMPKKGDIAIAYEPIWAIGSGAADTRDDAAHMANFIKKTVRRYRGIRNPRVLYGGSVNAKNIADFVQLDEVDGALVGGASLKAEEFKKMIKIVSKR